MSRKRELCSRVHFNRSNLSPFTKDYRDLDSLALYFLSNDFVVCTEKRIYLPLPQTPYSASSPCHSILIIPNDLR